MREQAGRKLDRRLPLFCLAPADRKAVENPALKVDVSAADRGHQRGAANGRRSRAGVKRDLDEPGDVPSDRAVRVLVSVSRARTDRLGTTYQRPAVATIPTP